MTLVAAAITTYMVPFAVLQLVSGTIAERVGARRVVRSAYVAFGVAALLCALAPRHLDVSRRARRWALPTLS